MAQLSKQALIVDNNTSFPNNTSNYITPAILRSFNVDMIDSLVDENTYNVDSASWNSNISQLNAFTASASGLTTSSLLITASASGPNITFTKGNGSQFTINAATDLSALNSFTQSAQISINNLNTATASLNTSVSNINTFTASTAISITNLNAATASFSTIVNGLVAKTGSYATTGSNTFVSANTFTSISASSFVSASQFVGDGTKITGITASVSLPILDEGIPQGNAVSMNFTGSGISAIIVGGTAVISVNTPDTGAINNITASFNAYTSSTDAKFVAVAASTSSLNSFTASNAITSLNSYTASNDTKWSTLSTLTSSNSASINQLNAFTASQITKNTTLSTYTASVDASSSMVNTKFTTLGTYTASVDTKFATIGSQTGSYISTATSNTFTQPNNFTSISASSFVSASAFVGDGSKLTNIPGAVPLTSLNAFTASAQISLNNLNAATSSYITSAVTSSMSVATASIALAVSTSISTQNLQHFITFTDSSTGKQNVYVDGGLKYNPNLDLVLTGNITASGYISASSLNLSSTLTASLQQGYVWVGDANNISTLVATSSFAAAPLTSLNAYTASNDTKWTTLGGQSGSWITSTQTASFATSFINPSLTSFSSSLFINSANAASSSYTFITASTNDSNIIFNDVLSGTAIAPTILTGSGNIISTTTGTSKFYYNGNGNIALTAGQGIINNSAAEARQITTIGNTLLTSATLTFPSSSNATKTFSNNIINGITTINVPSASLAATLTYTGNYIGAGLSIAAIKTPLTASTGNANSANIFNGGLINVEFASSSVRFSNNIINTGANSLNITSSYIGIGTNNRADFDCNLIAADNSRILYGGTPSTNIARTFYGNLMGGENITASLEAVGTDLGSLRDTAIWGYGLLVTGSTSATSTTTKGGAFFGRWNINDGIRNKNGENVFVIGAGTSDSARKNAFLIDSGSNTFVEGSLNVSGSSSFTGSVYGNVVSMSISSNTASMDFSTGNYFELTASVSPLNINVTNLKGGSTSTLAMNGVTASTITWSSNVLQPSGSAYTSSVSGSNDILSFVAFNNNKVNVVSTLKMI